jgi:hypothetical protein
MHFKSIKKIPDQICDVLPILQISDELHNALHHEFCGSFFTSLFARHCARLCWQKTYVSFQVFLYAQCFLIFLCSALRMYERTKNATESGRFFATNKWAYEDKNFKSLTDSLNECDKKRYNEIWHA